MATFTVQRIPRQTQYFVEDLGDKVGLDMVFIPSGSFQMGSNKTEEGHYDRESPQHLVKVSQFFMGRYPVTQSQWRTVAENYSKVNIELDSNPSNFKGDLHPVERVSWHEAVEFCDRLSAQTQRIYRLPSEAEWEYACRAGTSTPFHFGETISTDVANYRGQDWDIGGKTYPGKYGAGEYGQFRETTTPVNQFNTANAFGLVDMHANVWEWCLDHWHDNYESAPNDGSAWVTDGDSDRRILRGGSWYFFPADCRSALRSWDLPGVQDNFLGFRVVCAFPRTS